MARPDDTPKVPTTKQTETTTGKVGAQAFVTEPGGPPPEPPVDFIGPPAPPEPVPPAGPGGEPIFTIPGGPVILLPPAPPTPPAGPEIPILPISPIPPVVIIPPAEPVITPPVPPSPPEPVITPPAPPAEVVTPPAPPPAPVFDPSPILAAIESLRGDISAVSSRLDRLVANPPWATPSQIPALATSYTDTPEYRDQQSQIARARASADSANSAALAATGIARGAAIDAQRLQRVIEGIAANPNLVPVPPTTAEVRPVVQAVIAELGDLRGERGLRGLQGLQGIQGPPGPSLPESQVKDAIAALLPTIEFPPPPRGPIGPPGPEGPSGPPGPGVSPEVVQGAVASALSGVSGFLSAPTDYIWDVIIRGIRARFMALFEALLTEEKT